jgi:hypothetical protein
MSNLVVAGLARFRQLNSSAKQILCRFLTDLFQVLSDITFLCGSASPASSAPCKGVGFDASVLCVFQQLLVASGSFWAGSNRVWSDFGRQLSSAAIAANACQKHKNCLKRPSPKQPLNLATRNVWSLT